jgi:hypothetical protein
MCLAAEQGREGVMADSIDPKKDNKDAQSGEPVQLDEESPSAPPRPAQKSRPEQSPEQQGRPPQGGQQHGAA